MSDYLVLLQLVLKLQLITIRHLLLQLELHQSLRQYLLFERVTGLSLSWPSFQFRCFISYGYHCTDYFGQDITLI